MLASVEFLGVEWIGDKGPALEQIAPIVGSALVAAVAAFAAWLAAHTANSRQNNQLQQDSDRQQAQLEHDTDRQRHQLQHDREMRDREHLRTLLETVLISISQTITSLANLSTALRGLEAAKRKFDDAGDEESKSTAGEKRLRAIDDMGTQVEAAGSALTTTMLDDVRLRPFLPAEDQIVVTYTKLAIAMRDWRATLSVKRKEGDLHLRESKEIKDMEAKRDACDSVLKEFQAVCQMRFAVPEDNP